MIRVIKASPNGLREETGIKNIHRSASHARAQSAPEKRSFYLVIPKTHLLQISAIFPGAEKDLYVSGDFG